MPSTFSLSLRSRTLLQQLDLQCYHFQSQLAFIRRASSAASVKKQPTSAQTKTYIPPQIQASKEGNDKNPKPLNRPLGLPYFPSAGENDGVDPRDWRTRRDDFVNYDKHLERRKILTKQVARPYFRDWSNMRHQKGKVFIAPEKLFRSDKALYFPNLRGVTLAEPKDEQDTTPILNGRLSVVRVFSGTWAQNQTDTFLEGNVNFSKILAGGKGFLQTVDINIEENRLRAGLVKWFMGSLRRRTLQEQHERYFLVTRGITDDIRESIGIFNRQVGYVYLLDSECRIRWACSAEALPEEKDSMNRGLMRLVKEFKMLAEETEKAGKRVYLDIFGNPIVVDDLTVQVNRMLQEVDA